MNAEVEISLCIYFFVCVCVCACFCVFVPGWSKHSRAALVFIFSPKYLKWLKMHLWLAFLISPSFVSIIKLFCCQHHMQVTSRTNTFVVLLSVFKKNALNDILLCSWYGMVLMLKFAWTLFVCVPVCMRVCFLTYQ